MTRNGSRVNYTDDDKKNLVIRLHTPEEIKLSKKSFAKKRWKNRIIILLIFLLFLFLSIHASGEKAWFWLVGITMLIAIFWIHSELVTIPGAKIAGSPHYVELLVSQKLGVEFYTNVRVEHYTGEFFYPIQAIDTTSKYQCLYYLSQDEYNIAEPGQTIKVNVLLKDLAPKQ
jgi:hypothetical protein